MRKTKDRLTGFPKRKNLGLVTASLFLLLSLFGGQIWAQPKPPQPTQFKNLDAPLPKIQPSRVIKHPPVNVQLKPGTIKVNKLQPIQFKPFTMQELRHPKTHPVKADQPIDPDEEITITQKISGEVKTFKIKGRDLLNEINKLEQKYNTLGYTIRRPVKTPIVINESIMNQDSLQKQRQNSRHKYRPLEQEQVKVMAPKFANMQGRYSQRLQQMPSIIQNLKQVQPALSDTFQEPIEKEESYYDFWGDRNLFAAGLHGKVKFYADKDILKASAEGKATVVVFNNPEVVFNNPEGWTVFSIEGRAEVPTADPNGQMHAYLSATALGEDLFAPIDTRGKASLVVEDDQSIEVDKSIKIPVVELGPFSINVTLGFQGRAGVRYGIYLQPGSLEAKFAPYVKTRAYGQVGLNVWLIVSIEAGVGTSLTLLNDSLTLSTSAGIAFDQGQPKFFYEYYAQNTITTLDGEIYAYVTVDYYIDSTTWKWTIFDWDGFTHDGYVIGPVGYNVPVRANEKSDAWQVTVYDHLNYGAGGGEKTYIIHPGDCQAQEGWLGAIGWNDKISSLKVGKNVAVYLFEHCPYSGKFIRFDTDVPDLRKHDFNDRASSLMVFTKSMGHPLGVWLIGNQSSFRYLAEKDDINRCPCKTYKVYHPKVHYDDDATKVIIPPIAPQFPQWGYIEVELFEHKSYKGQTVKFRAGPSGGEFPLPPELSRKVSSMIISLTVNDPNLLGRPCW